MIHYAELGAVAYVNGHPHWNNRAVPVTVKGRRRLAVVRHKAAWLKGQA